MEQRDLRSYLRPVLKRWWLILAVVPIVTVGTYLYYDAKPKTYQASTELYFAPSSLQEAIFGSRVDTKSKVEDSALLIQTTEVGERAEKILVNEAKRTGGTPVPAGGISAQAIDNSSFIVITATADSAVGAARLANAYAVAFMRMQRGQISREAKAIIKATEKQLKEIPKTEETLRRREAMAAKIQELTLATGQSRSGGIRQVDPAVPPAVPVDHDPMQNAIFAFVIGLMLAVGGAYGLEYLNRRIGRIEDVEEVYGLPILTEVPKVGSPAPGGENGVVIAKSLVGPFQRLQANLDLIGRERPIRTILVASAAPGEGKSIVARNLGIAYREAGRNVAVLDADFRRASLGGLLAAHEGLGLSDVLAGRATFGQVVQEVPRPATINGNGGELAMVPAGDAHGRAGTALASNEMRQTMRTAADTYGTAIIDSPPLLAVPDVLPLLSEADAVVLVMRLGVSTRDSAQRLLAEIERVPGAFVAGIVVNGIPRRLYRARSYGYYDG